MAGAAVTSAAPTRLRGYDLVPFVCSVVASTGIFVVMVLICADIAMRFFFSAPINGVADVVANGIVACVLLQIGSTIRDDRLIRADFIFGGWALRRPQFAALLDALFFGAASFVFTKALIWLWGDFHKSYATGEFAGAVGAYMLTLWPFKLAVLVGAAVALVETLRKTASSLVRLARPVPTAAQPAPSLRRDAAPVAILAIGIAGFFVLNFGIVSSSIAVGLLSLGALLLAVTIGMPIAIALLSLSYVGVWLTRGNETVAENALGIAMSGAIRSYEFGAVALFIIMGLLLEKADVGRDAFKVAVYALRRVRGGLGVATVVANAIFASITGSSIASASVFSRISVPPMVESGYTKRFAVGVVAGSSVLGMLIPPSLLLIIYGLIAEASIGSLFIAAILPGILLATAFSVLCVGLAVFFPAFVGKPNDVAIEPMKLSEMAVRLLPIVAIVVAVMGGIYGGVFSPTEAGAVGALCALVVGIVRRKLDFAAFRSLVLDAGYISAAILFLIIAANLYGRMLTLSTIPMQMGTVMTVLDIGLPGFLAIYLVIVLLLGMILDPTSIMLILLPIVLPVLATFGGDPVWFGVVTVIAIEIGLLTPPFGLSVFVVKSALPRDFISLGEIFTGTFPFVLMMILVTILVMAFPQIALVLVGR
jgi:tripartite ATP-independent transporter DctM subunit